MVMCKLNLFSAIHYNHLLQVVSLLDYDDADTGSKYKPSPGYPLVCITVSTC